MAEGPAETGREDIRYIEVLEPLPQRRVVRRDVSPRLGTLKNKIVGFLDNTKPNAGVLLAALADLLEREYGADTRIQVRKKWVNNSAERELLDRLVADCDAVVTASGD